jgi:hypothetical protein
MVTPAMRATLHTPSFLRSVQFAIDPTPDQPHTI